MIITDLKGAEDKTERNSMGLSTWDVLLVFKARKLYWDGCFLKDQSTW